MALAGVSTPASAGSRSPSIARHSPLSPNMTAVALYPGSPLAATLQM